MRVFRCGHCKHTYDLAVTVPELQVQLGRELTDKEMDELHTGWWHSCVKTALQEESPTPRQCLTKYDWRTR